VTAGVALGLAGVLAAEAATDEASAQGGFSVSAEQLRINQRISQAAVRRSNESLDLLDPVRKSGASDTAPGWGTAAIASNAITEAKLSSAVREGQPRWAVVTETTGALSRGSGVTTSTKLAGVGLYEVTFDRDVSACSIQATIAATGTTPLGADLGRIGAWVSATDNKVVTVRTDETVTGTPNNGFPFHVTVLC
jgi:hypothetical protein